MSRTRIGSAILVAGLLALTGLTRAGDRPQWGERFTRNQTSDETGLAADFDPASGRNLRWTAALGTETHATPVVAAGRIYIGTNNHRPRDPRHQGDRNVLLCLAAADGRLLWQLVVPKLGPDPYLDWPGGGTCSPPTVEGKRVYLPTSRGEVVCLDAQGLADGNAGPFTDEAAHATPEGAAPVELGPLDADIVWLTDLRREVGVYPHDAAHGSPLLDGPVLYVNTGNGVDNTHRRIRAPDAPSLVALAAADGRLLARDAEHLGPLTFHCTWSSPALAETAGRRCLVYGAPDGVVYGFDLLVGVPPAGAPVDLERVWRFDADPTAPKQDVHRFVGNRNESPSTIAGMPVVHQGRLYVTVGGDLWWGKRQARLLCLDLAGRGTDPTPTLVWEYALAPHACATPAVRDGLAYVTDTGGRLHCLDAGTGQAVWVQETQSEVWGSALVADGKAYVGTRRGQLWVLAAGREKKVLATIDLHSPISSTPVAANGVLYVSTYDRLYAVAPPPRP